MLRSLQGCPHTASSHQHIRGSCSATDDQSMSGCALGAQVGLLRLTALAAKLAPSSAASGGSRLMLWFLQCLLAHCLSAINTLVAGEVQAVLGPRPDVMDRYLGKGASFCSRQAREPGEAEKGHGRNPSLMLRTW